MKEYRVITEKHRRSEDTMNEFARDGWKVISVIPNDPECLNLTITFEREVK